MVAMIQVTGLRAQGSKKFFMRIVLRMTGQGAVG